MLQEIRKRVCCRGDHDDVDELTWWWFQRARSASTPVCGPMIQEQGHVYGNQLQKTDFIACNGWLQRFKARHIIAAATLSGERESVSQDTVNTWKERLPGIIAGFEQRDIFNMDETGTCTSGQDVGRERI